MTSRANLSWRHAVLSVLLMTSAVSANYQTGDAPRVLDTVRSVQQIDQQLSGRSPLDTLGPLPAAGGVTDNTNDNAPAGGKKAKGVADLCWH